MRSVTLAFVLVAANAAGAAENNKYPSGVESILSSLSGVVSATQQNVELGRSVDRLSQIRRIVNGQLASNFSPDGKISLTALTRSSILCDPRGAHAALVAHRAYLSTLTTEVERVATPGEIKTLLDAIKLIFQDYSIDVAYSGQKEQAKLRDEAIARCKGEVIRLSSAYYFVPVGQPTPVAANAATQVDVVYAATDSTNNDIQVAAIGSLTLFQTLLDAINAIVNPIAKEADRQARLAEVRNFLTNWRTRITTTAQALTDSSSKLAEIRKAQTLGQFSEQIEVLRALPIELKSVDGCKNIKAGDKPFSEVTDPSDSQKKLSIPTDSFVACYAGVWKIVSERVNLSLKAASEYDGFADAVSGKEQEVVKKLKGQIEKLDEIDLQELWNGAMQLVAFGKMMNEALSKEKRDKVRSAIDDLTKAL